MWTELDWTGLGWALLWQVLERRKGEGKHWQVRKRSSWIQCKRDQGLSDVLTGRKEFKVRGSVELDLPGHLLVKAARKAS